MASARKPGSVQSALYDVLLRLTDEDVNLATGKTKDALQRKSRMSGYAGLTLEEAAGFDALLGQRSEEEPFRAIFDELVAVKRRELSNLPRDPEVPLALKILRLNVEVGKLSEAVERAQAENSDGGRRITTAEWRELMSAAEEVKRVITHLEQLARKRSRL